MLQEANALRARGAWSTIAGRTSKRMDVDAILRRKPHVCLVDELVHSNVPGSRNTKRYRPRRRGPSCPADRDQSLGTPKENCVFEQGLLAADKTSDAAY